MSALVVLPKDALISLWSLARAIACALRPVIGAGASGMDCVTGKRVDSARPIMDSRSDIQEGVSITDSDLKKDSFSATERWWAQFELAPEDCQALQELLPQLPELRYPIDDGRRLEFLAAYRKLAHGRYDWEPVLLTGGDVAEQQAEQDGVRRQYVDALRAAFDAGTLVVCDANHIPVKRIVFTTDCFVPKHAAIAYLKQIGLAHVDAVAVVTASDSRPSQPASEEFVVSERGANAWLDASVAERAREHSRKPEWTPERYQELEDFHRNAGRAATKACAERFGIGTRMVRRKREIWRTHPQNPKNLLARMAGR